MECQVHSSHIHDNHKITTKANKHQGKKSSINKYMSNPSDVKLCISNKNCLFAIARHLNAVQLSNISAKCQEKPEEGAWRKLREPYKFKPQLPEQAILRAGLA